MKHKILVAFVSLAFSGIAGAQTIWPSGQTVRIIVPFPGGASTLDSVVRTLTPEISKNLSSPVIVDNRPGANGRGFKAIQPRCRYSIALFGTRFCYSNAESAQ
jgi:tripartite-type tricarboxylate transporter receptor subunit TctC